MYNRKLLSIYICLLGIFVVQAQDTTPETPAAKVVGVIVDGLIYPTNFSTIETPKAGILGLRAIDIPRYTQTGPLPSPAPERHWVLAPVPHNPKLPTIWIIGDSTVRCGVNATGDDMPGQWGWGTPFPKRSVLKGERSWISISGPMKSPGSPGCQKSKPF